MKIENNPHYQHGVFVGSNVAKHIELTTYRTLDDALQRKRELVEDLKEQFGWDETHKDVAETLGIIAALEQAQSIKKEKEKQEVKHDLAAEDVNNVAQEIGQTVDEAEVQLILSNYVSAQDNDPTATWNLVIEHLIYEVKNGNL